MEIWDTPILSTVENIVEVLRVQLKSESINLLRDMKVSGRNLQVTCINHGNGQERKPSMGISTVIVHRDGKKYPEGTCHCYSCGYTADFPTFISNCFGYNDAGMYGYKWLTQNFVNLSVEVRKPIELNMSREKPKPKEVEYVNEEELDSYRYTHPYMYHRKLTEKVIEYFDIGYDPKTDALTFPVKDLTGKVLMVQRRATYGKAFLNDEKSRGEVIYGLYEVYQNISKLEEVFVCESILDALTCWVYGKPGVALMGAIPTNPQIRMLRELPVRKIIRSLDNDKAGLEGTERLKRLLGGDKVLYQVHFPEWAKDMNDLSEEDFNNLQITII